jgi:hypothetical protein
MKRYSWQTKATTNKLSTKFGLVARSINLVDFGAKWKRTTPTGRKTKGVSYKLKNKRRVMKGSFIAKGYVFSRRKGERDNLIPHFSITPTSMFLGAEADDLYIEQYFKTFDKTYAHQIKYLMSK